jgi:hypothetical protein
MTDYTPSGKPIAGRAISKEIRSEFEDRIAPAINSKANIASPALTGAPTAPTATAGSAGNQIATLDFVNATSFSSNLPGQIGNNGKVIVTDGTNASWTDAFTVPWTFSDVVSVDAAMTMTDAINTARATVAAHATTADIWGAAGNEINFTGTATITDFPDAPQSGVSRVLHIAGTPTFTHNANISLPNSTDYTAESGDIAIIHAITTTTFRVVFHQVNALVVRKIPIFDASTLNKTAVSSNDDIAAQSYATGLASGTINVVFGIGLFVAYTSVSSGFVATSPDGETWTLRAMPSSTVWRVGFAGGKFLASADGSTTMAQSTDGITWSAATSLPGNAQSGTSNAPVGIGSTWIIHGSTTTNYRSTDGGANWTSQTLPITNTGGWFMVVGSNFIYASTTINTYISGTGATGSWTLDSIPSSGTAVSIWKNPDGSLGVQATTGTHRSTDGDSWSVVVPAYLSDRSAFNQHRFYINGGVTGIWSTTSGYSYTFHGITPVLRSSTRNIVSANRLSASDGAGVSIIGADSGYVIKVSDSLTGLFIL